MSNTTNVTKKDLSRRVADSMRIVKCLRDAGYFVTDVNRQKWQKHSNEYVRDGVGSTFQMSIVGGDKYPVQVVLSTSRDSYVVQYR